MPVIRPIGLLRPLVVLVVSFAAATVVVGYLQDSLGVPNPSAVYLVAVVATALVSGTAGAILASVASFLLYNFLFTEPRGSFSIVDPAVWISVLLLLFVGIVVGQLTALQRARTATAEAREREARAMFRLSRALATRESTVAVLPEIVGIAAAEGPMDRAWIALGADDAAERVAADTAPGPPAAPTGLVSVLRRQPGDAPALWVRVHPAGRTRGGGDTFRVRIEAGGATLGSIWAVRARGLGQPDRTATRLLAAAADQVGQAIAQDRLARAARDAEVARQSDALKSALLQSVSHDLRTPLGVIRIAADTLRPEGGLTPEERRDRIDTIGREVEHLNRLVTNLLDLSRIEAGALRVERDAVELDDVLARALDRLRARAGGRLLTVELDAPPVAVDPILLETAFTNVADNAIGYTPEDASVRISVGTAEAGFVRLTVEDGGPGVPDDALPRLFERFYRVPMPAVPRPSGTGIGLAVTRGLIGAMGGQVGARRSSLGGLAIDIDLPLAVIPAELDRSAVESTPRSVA